METPIRDGRRRGGNAKIINFRGRRIAYTPISYRTTVGRGRLIGDGEFRRNTENVSAKNDYVSRTGVRGVVREGAGNDFRKYGARFVSDVGGEEAVR